MVMSSMSLKETLPTFHHLVEKHKEAQKNQLPKHLRPLPKSPILFQMGLNSGIIAMISWLMMNQDEFDNEAKPAIGLVVCFLVLIYTLISAFQLKVRYEKLRLARLTKINFWMMVSAFLMWAAGIVY